MSTSDLDTLKHAAAAKAVEFVKDGMVLGLGTGSTAKHLIMALGEKVKAGMKLSGVSTSQETAMLARQCGIALIDADFQCAIDVAFDGADQVDPAFNLIKGGGGALLKEKIVAASAMKFVVMGCVACRRIASRSSTKHSSSASELNRLKSSWCAGFDTLADCRGASTSSHAP